MLTRNDILDNFGSYKKIIPILIIFEPIIVFLLTRFHAYQNKDAICHLESLEQLDLGENEIDSLPVNFGALTKLRELWLDTNDIKVLPQSIGGLKDLSIADFANNKIEVIPDTIEGCIRIGYVCFVSMVNVFL